MNSEKDRIGGSPGRVELDLVLFPGLTSLTWVTAVLRCEDGGEEMFGFGSVASDGASAVVVPSRFDSSLGLAVDSHLMVFAIWDR